MECKHRANECKSGQNMTAKMPICQNMTSDNAKIAKSSEKLKWTFSYQKFSILLILTDLDKGTISTCLSALHVSSPIISFN